MDMTVREIMEKLVAGENVEIKGFGKFTIETVGEKTVRNPKTGETKKQGPKKVPKFRFSHALKLKVKELPVD